MGLYAHTTRGAGTVLTGTWSGAVVATTTEDLFNGDHENHVTHTDPTYIDSWESDQAGNLSQTNMDKETNPMPAGVFSLPLALSDELERIRFVLTAIKAAMQSSTAPLHWYTPALTNASFVTLPPTGVRRNANVTEPINSSANANVSTVLILFVNAYLHMGTTVYDSTGGAGVGDAFGPVAPVNGIYLVGATTQFGEPVDRGFQMILTRWAIGRAGTPSRIASSEHILRSAGANVAHAVGTVAHFAKGDTFLTLLLQVNATNASKTLSSGAAYMTLLARTVT